MAWYDGPAGSAGEVPLVDAGTANAARIYDFLLGGKDNFAVDRVAAGELLRVLPRSVRACRDNRGFLQRAVRFLVSAGIRQFLDIGTGLPTMGNVHEVAQEAAAGCRVAYVDNDPVVLCHARALLATSPEVIVARGDLTDPGAIVADPAIRGHLDFSRPVGVLLVAVPHFIQDADQPAAIVRTLAGAVAPGSYLALSHVTADHVPAQAKVTAEGVYPGASAPVIPRTRAQVTALFEGLELAGPGVTDVAAWQGGPGPAGGPGRGTGYMYAGVARKP